MAESVLQLIRIPKVQIAAVAQELDLPHRKEMAVRDGTGQRSP